MDSNHRGLRWVVLMFMVVIWGGCDATDDGAWIREANPTPTPIAEATPNPEPIDSVGRLTFNPDQPQADRSTWVRCDVLPANPIQLQVSGDKVPSYPAADDRVCLGEQGSQPAPTLCREVDAYEARAATVSACYQKIRYLLGERSKEVLGEHWAATVLPLLPKIWSRTPEEVNLLSYRISYGIVKLMTGGTGAESAPGTPLCFPTNGQPAELAGLIAVNKMQILIRDTTRELDEVTSALRRGIDVQVNEDLQLQLVAHFIEMPTPDIEPVDCRFEVPPPS